MAVVILVVNTDSEGQSSLQTQLALNGSQDGVHVVHFRAIDHVGLISPVCQFPLHARYVHSTDLIEGLTSGGTVHVGTFLSGTAQGTGSTVTSLVYQIDAGPRMPLSLNQALDVFSQRLDLSKVTVALTQ